MAIIQRPDVGEFSPDGSKVRTPVSKGKRTFYAAFGTFGVLALFSPFLYEDLHGEDLRNQFYWMIPGALLGLIGLYKAFLDPLEWTATPEEQVRQAQAEQEMRENDPVDKAINKVFTTWYLRYPLGGLLTWYIVYRMIPNAGSDWSTREYFFIVGASIVALLLAREVALILLGIGALLIVGNFVSDVHLSTPGAILIGALIIAYAISESNRKR